VVSFDSAASNDYSVFGLRVRSELALPELFPATGNAAPDITIRLGAIDELPDARRGIHVVEGGLLFVIPDAGRYRAAGGDEILVDPKLGVPDRNVRLYLLGSVFGALLHQRGRLPLHANAVQIDGKAAAFMGESGSGKSTLAAWFHDQGFQIIADDVCVVKFNAEGQATAVPGLPRLRLWQEALEATGREANDFHRSYVGDDSWNKFDVPITREIAEQREVELSAVYLLERGDAFDIRRLEGIEAAEAVFAHTYRGAFVTALKGEQSHWAASMRLVQGTPVYRLTRTWSLKRMDEEGHKILGHAEALVGTQPTERAAAP
jgi:hypothetical protein